MSFFISLKKKNNLSYCNLDKKINEIGLIIIVTTLWLMAFYSIQIFFQYGILYREIYTCWNPKEFWNVFISYIFKNFYIYLAYFLLIRFLCFKNITLAKKFSLMLLTLLPLSIITLGRFPTYEIIFFSIIIIIFGDGKNIKKILAAVIIFALTMSAIVFSLKVSSENIPLFLIVEESSLIILSITTLLVFILLIGLLKTMLYSCQKIILATHLVFLKIFLFISLKIFMALIWELAV